MNRKKYDTHILNESDLDFVIRQAAPGYQNQEKLKQAVRDDESFRKTMIGDDKVFLAVTADPEIMLKISPSLYFEILLRRTLKEVAKARYTLERVGGSQVPVFDTEAVAAFLDQEGILQYLAAMLASFTRTESHVRRIRVRKGLWRRIRFSDMDIDALIGKCGTVEEKDRFGLYKRIADLCLFIPGLFPAQAFFDYGPSHLGETRPGIRAAKRGLQEYEETGKTFYKLAAKHVTAETLDLSSIFLLLGENMAMARKPLNFISQKYLNLSKLLPQHS